LLERGTPSTHLPKPGQPMRYGVEMKAFFTLDDFKAYAEKEDLQEHKFIGVFELGAPIPVSTEVTTVEVEKKEWKINP